MSRGLNARVQDADVVAGAVRNPAAAPVRTPPRPPGPSRSPVHAARRQAPRRGPRLAAVGFLATAALLAWGYRFPTEQYITPRTGLGYALGIAGGSAMLILLVYPLRKRFRVLGFIGTTKRWFQAHMALGVLGPALILFHSNFSLGATNSNVALACMLVVSGSGLFGRYFYARIHHGLHGRKANLAELREYAEKLRWVSTNVEFLPGLVERIDAEERRIVERCERATPLARPLLAAAAVWGARRRLRRFVRRADSEAATRPGGAARQSGGVRTVARRYIDDRLGATRRVVEFGAFERLFSLWHALHMPLFLMLLIAGVVHVVAVHLY
jgi:hypothetical protein